MGQLAFLLIGSDSLRRRWFVVALFGALLIVLGLLNGFDALDGVTLVTTQGFGLVFLIQGLLALVSLLSTERGMSTYLTLVRGLMLIIIAGLILDLPTRNHFLVSIFFAAAFVIDGVLRILTANALRYSAWKGVVAFAVAEFIIAALLLTSWPLSPEKNIPFCVSVSLLFSGWVLVRMSLMLRRLEPEVAILALPMFGKRAWYDNAPVLIGFGAEEPKPEHPMTVRVWTPVGSADVARRRLVLDRYIAAVDRNGVISTGHAALEALPDIYVSHYPAVEIDRSSGDFMAMFKATKENDVPGRFQPSYAVESAGWTDSDSNVVFWNYSPRRLRAFWAGYRQDNTYNLTNRNCSVAVASAIDAALEGSLASERPWVRLLRLLCNPDLWIAVMLRQRAETMTWTPGYALDYARALHRLVEPHEVPFLERLRKAFAIARGTSSAPTGEPAVPAPPAA